MSDSSVRVQLESHLLLIAAAFFWGINPMLMKFGLAEIPPIPYTAMRLAFATLVLVPFQFAWRAETRRARSLARSTVQHRDYRLMVVPVLAFSAFLALFTFSVNYTPASVASVVAGILPITVAIITRLMGTEQITRRRLIGILATFAGVMLITMAGGGDRIFRNSMVLGVILMVIAEFAFGLYSVSLNKTRRVFSAPLVLFYTMLTGALLYAGYTLPVYGWEVYRGVSLLAVGSALFSSVFSLMLANMLWSLGIGRIGSLGASVYGNLPPVFGIAAGIIVLQETLAPRQIAGAVTILAGIFVVNTRRAR